MEKEKPPLEEIFSPRGVAVIGASPSGMGGQFVQGLQKAGFPAIYPVNSKYTEVSGLPCYPNLKAIPAVVDHVIVTIPAESSLALLDDCAAKGVKSVHFFTAGFGESGYTERAKLESAMLDKARAGGFRIIGPNCWGIFVPKNHLSHAAFRNPLKAGPIAFISQSGGNARGFPDKAYPRGLHLSKMVSYGNALDVDESELLQYFAQDPETKIIAAYIEGVKDGRRFMSALGEASARKPVVIYKGGTTEAGKRAAFGHTASLTSSAAVFDALCRQMKTIQVNNMDELIDVLVALRFANPLPHGTEVAVLGMGGGPTVLAGDEMEKAGLHLPRLSSEVEEELRKVLPLAGSIFGNPLDATPLMSGEGISMTMPVFGKFQNAQMFVYHLGFHPATSWGDGRFSSAAFLQSAIDAFIETRQATGKPVLLALNPPIDLEGMKDFLAAQEAFIAAGLPVFYSLHNLAKAMARVVAWNQARQHQNDTIQVLTGK